MLLRNSDKTNAFMPVSSVNLAIISQYSLIEGVIPQKFENYFVVAHVWITMYNRFQQKLQTQNFYMIH